MRAREWDQIYRLTPEQFRAWLHCQPDTVSWSCGDGCCCPLQDFIEKRTGFDLFVGDDLTEHWAPAWHPTKTCAKPSWMSDFIWALNQTKQDRITAAEALMLQWQSDG